MTTYKNVSIEGIKIFYREAGPAKGPVLLLLHGFPSSSHMYRNLIPKLSDSYRVIAPDYPGFGQSDAPDRRHFHYTFDRLAEIMNGFVQALGLTRFSLYVQDYGGPIGFRMAVEHPEWIENLIIQNANAYPEGFSTTLVQMATPFWQNRSPETEAPFRNWMRLEGTKSQYVQGAAHPERISPDTWTLDQFYLDRPGNVDIQLDLLHNYASNIEFFPKIHAYFRKHRPPTLIVWGKNDPYFTVEGAQAYKKDLPAATLHILNTGHFALEEESGTIADYSLKFLDAQSVVRRA